MSLPLETRRNILLSLACGDALGAATEFATPAQLERRFPEGIKDFQEGSPFGFAPGESTDDSQMTLATLWGLLDPGPPLENTLEQYQAWSDSGPPDMGAHTRRALQGRTRRGGYIAWLETGKDGAGNGALMRVAGVLVAGKEGEEALLFAASTSFLTHADPRCILSSVFFTALLEEVSGGMALPEGAQVAWTRTLQGQDTLLEHLVLEGLLPTEDLKPYRTRWNEDLERVQTATERGLARIVGKQSGYTLDCLQAALAHASKATDWLEALEKVALLGDDSDTVGAVAGALLGAMGFTPPAHLLERLRVGHTWAGANGRVWQREWTLLEQVDSLLG